MYRVLSILLALLFAAAVVHPATMPKMRPYSGQGVVELSLAAPEGGDAARVFALYQEPGIGRQEELQSTRAPFMEWIFKRTASHVPLLVMARKGNWLKVVYDEAGREAWLNPGRRGRYLPWESYLRHQGGRLLPGLRKQYYQLCAQPGKAPVATLTPKQLFRMLKVDTDWALVAVDQSTLGWLRWRDEDSRLLVSLEATDAQNR